MSQGLFNKNSLLISTFLLPAHPDSPEQNPESHKMVVVVVVVVIVVILLISFLNMPSVFQ